MKFHKKIAIVTGGASGIGAATVRRIVTEGGQVLVADINDELGNQMVAELPEGSAVYHHTDVASLGEVEQMVAAAISTFGGIDILVNNAGIGVFSETPDLSPEEWHKTIDINLHSVFMAVAQPFPKCANEEVAR